MSPCPPEASLPVESENESDGGGRVGCSEGAIGVALANCAIATLAPGPGGAEELKLLAGKGVGGGE